MKRALTIALSVALLSSVLFAGGVAAQEVFDSEQEAELDQYAETEIAQDQDVSQSNVALQGGNVAYADDGSTATASNNADQSNSNSQTAVASSTNDATIDQESEQEIELDAFF